MIQYNAAQGPSHASSIIICPADLPCALADPKQQRACTALFKTFMTHACRYDMREEDVARAVTSALDLVNMGDAGKRAAHTLSGGQRQRVAIAGGSGNVWHSFPLIL